MTLSTFEGSLLQNTYIVRYHHIMMSYHFVSLENICSSLFYYFMDKAEQQDYISTAQAQCWNYMYAKLLFMLETQNTVSAK